jgi:folate-binding protein YgfZ
MTTVTNAIAPVFARLDDLGLIECEGPDARAFLQGQLTSDVNALTPDRCHYSGYCTAKGRLLATFLLWQRGHAFYLQIPGDLREPMQKQLSKFILRSKVKLRDASTEYACLGMSGCAADQLARIVGAIPPAPYDVRHTTDTTVVSLPVNRYLIVVAAAKAPAIAKMLSATAIPVAGEVWKGLDICAGVAVIAPATQEEFVPQMVNLDLIGGVSFTKGCYPGQEIVARMHYLGRLKQRMYLAHIASQEAPRAGDKLYSPHFGEQACGKIVSAAPAPGGGYHALAVMQIDQAKDGNVHSLSAEGPLLRLLELPYAITTA